MKTTVFGSLISKVTGKKETGNNHLYGFIFAFSTGLVLALTSVCSKNLYYITYSQNVAQCSAGMIVYSLPIILHKRLKFIYPTKVTLLLLARGIFTAMAFNFMFLSLRYIPLADSSVIGSCSPILTTVFAKVFLKEPCGVLHCICLVLTVLGVLLVSKLPLLAITRTVQYGVSYFVGVILSLSGAFSFAMANIIVRTPSLISVHYSISVLYIGIFTVGISCLITNFTYGFVLPECGIDQRYMAFQCIVGGLVEMLATLALQYEEASIAIMVISTTNIVTSFLWQTLVGGEEANVYTTSGAVIVVTCIVMVAVRQPLLSFIRRICGRSSTITETE